MTLINSVMTQNKKGLDWENSGRLSLMSKSGLRFKISCLFVIDLLKKDPHLKRVLACLSSNSVKLSIIGAAAIKIAQCTLLCQEFVT